jgi:hypothetical protein
MKPFLSFFGGKHRMAKRLGRPQYSHVIEPFAGSLGYSTYWRPAQVTAVEKDPLLASVWRYLIKASPEEIMRIPADVDSVDDPRLRKFSQEERWLIGFWLNHGQIAPVKQRSKWAGQYIHANYWGYKLRERIAGQVPLIKHWRIIEGDWWEAPNIEAHWHIDPPYQVQGQNYKFNKIDFTELGKWCLARKGFTQVCENNGATWLPFVQFANVKSTRGKNRKGTSAEAVYEQGTGRTFNFNFKKEKSNGFESRTRAKRHARHKVGKGPAEISGVLLQENPKPGRRQLETAITRSPEVVQRRR